MAWAKCDFYLPKGSTSALLLEGKQHLLRLLQEIPLNEAEHAAVEEGIVAYESLLAKLADVPTPSGSTPRQIDAGLVSVTALQPRTLRPSCHPDQRTLDQEVFLRRLSRSDEVGRLVANFLDRRDRMQDHFSPVDELLNRTQGVDWVRGCGTGCGKRRCEQDHKHHGQNTRYVDEWVRRADFEEEGPDKAWYG